MTIAYEKKCSHCSKDVKAEDIVKEEELSVIQSDSARVIKILDFVDLTDIDPIYFEKPYYLSPDMACAGAYSLLGFGV